jgi:hypothetical protein
VVVVQQFVSAGVAVPGSPLIFNGIVPPSTQTFKGNPANTRISAISPVIQSVYSKVVSLVPSEVKV